MRLTIIAFSFLASAAAIAQSPSPAVAPSFSRPTVADYPGIGAFNRGDYVTARSEMEEAAKSEHLLAMTYLARIYNEGLGTTRDPKRAYELYKRLAEKGDRSAMIQLGDLTLEGIAPNGGNGAAHAWYEMAAAKGSAEGYCRMAKLVAPAPGTNGNPQRQAEYLLKAAQETSISPQSSCANTARKQLAKMYAEGRGVPKNACMSIKFRGELVTYGGGEGNWAGAEQRRRDPELQSVILAMIVTQYNRNSTVSKEAFVKAVVSDYSEPFSSLLRAVLMKHGLGIQQDMLASSRLAEESIEKMQDVEVFGSTTARQWARWFYGFDFSCLRLAR